MYMYFLQDAITIVKQKINGTIVKCEDSEIQASTTENSNQEEGENDEEHRIVHWRKIPCSKKQQNSYTE